MRGRTPNNVISAERKKWRSVLASLFTWRTLSERRKWVNKLISYIGALFVGAIIGIALNLIWVDVIIAGIALYLFGIFWIPPLALITFFQVPRKNRFYIIQFALGATLAACILRVIFTDRIVGWTFVELFVIFISNFFAMVFTASFLVWAIEIHSKEKQCSKNP